LRDVSQPAVDPQQAAAAEASQTISPDLDAPQYSQVTQDHVTWDWINDIPVTSPFEMILEEVTGIADSLTENDWLEWNLGESSGTFRNMLESVEIWQNPMESSRSIRNQTSSEADKIVDHSQN
jgi:hypothetical protein